MLGDLKKIFKVYQKELFDYNKNSFFESLYRLLAIIIFPIIKNLKPNFITFISISFGFVVLVAFLNNYIINLNIILLFFLASFILDFSDGMVARYQKKTSFNGRFLDGLFDIIVLGILHIIFYEIIKNEGKNFFHTYFYLLTLVLLPIQHLIIDRYSAIARWINEDKKKKIKPYVRNIYLGNLTKIFFDLQHFCIWTLFIFKSKYLYFIDIFYLLSFMASSLSIGIYIFLSDKYFSNSNNQSDNRA